VSSQRDEGPSRAQETASAAIESPGRPADASLSAVISSVGRGRSPEDVSDLVRAVGEAAHDRYSGHREIAVGGMGAVHRVTDRSLARTLACKVMHADLAEQRDAAEMFLREARLTGQLDHPNVVPVHELGVDDAGRLFFTMKLVEGRTLRDWIRSLPPEGRIERSELFDLLDVVLKVCDALAFAHSRGVLHCDIKPANVMVGEYGQVYLMDWGVARLLAEEQARALCSGAEDERVIGTTSHMPPEQARGEPLDVRADVFAMGALLYHVLTRRAPYRGQSEVQLLAAALLCRYPHIDELMGEGVVPPALSRIVLQAMAKNPDDRFASIGELRDELQRFLRGEELFEALVVEPGEVIVREGETGEEAFIIESGQCEVTREGARIRVMGAGEVFGEMSILSPGPRTATVRAIERSVLRRVGADALREELDSMKPWMGALVRTLADRFREREQERQRGG
jgi:eukaryotic-like serine/threonine-protein kinase